MADDVTLPGTGVIVAADEIAGKKHQRVKIQFGGEGVATDVSDESPLPVTMASAGLATTEKQDELKALIGEVQETPTANTLLARVKSIFMALSDGTARMVLNAGSAIIGKVGIDQTTPGTTNAVVMKTSGGTEVSFADPTTGTLTTKDDSTTAAEMLAANAARKGGCLRNNSTAIAYVNFSTTDPTATTCSVEMAGRTSLGAAYVEIPFGYTGQIKAVWASDAGGSMSVTELT